MTRFLGGRLPLWTLGAVLLAAACGESDLSPQAQEMYDGLSECSKTFLRDLDEAHDLDLIGPLVVFGMGDRLGRDPSPPSREAWEVAREGILAAESLRQATAQRIVAEAFVTCGDANCHRDEGAFWYAIGRALAADVGDRCEPDEPTGGAGSGNGESTESEGGQDCGCERYSGFRRLQCAIGDEFLPECP